MAVRIRMKKMGRRHRPFFRICAMDTRSPRDGKVIEELGYYDPTVRETDARAVLNGQRVDYWLSVGAQPSEKVRVLIKKYGSNGTHLEQQQAALERVKATKPSAPPPKPVPKKEEPAAEQAGPGEETPADETPPQETPAEAGAAEAGAAEAPAAEAPAGQAEGGEQAEGGGQAEGGEQAAEEKPAPSAE